MNVSRLTRRFLDSTRGQIILLLRTESRTVTDLAQALDLTDNAVRGHLTTLERDGLVRQAGEKPGFRKPHFAYELTAEADDIFPKAYGPLLNLVLAELKDRFGEKQTAATLREVAQRMADSHAAAPGMTLDERVGEAVKLIAKLGGHARIEHAEGKVVIRGAGCPLALVTADHAEVCEMVRTLLATIIDAPVIEVCQRSPSPKCCFEVTASAGVQDTNVGRE